LVPRLTEWFSFLVGARPTGFRRARVGAGMLAGGGYEIPFNRHFYQYEPPRSLEELDADLDVLSSEIMEMLREVHS
jgi:hypothetical protein